VAGDEDEDCGCRKCNCTSVQSGCWGCR
jgi:hypothetical protein